MRALLTRLRGDAGFTVAEYLSAAVILFVVTVATTGGLTFASASTANSAKREQAMNLANQRLEQARNLPYDQIGVRYAEGGYGNPPGEIVSPEIVGEFTVTTQVKWKRDQATSRATYKKVYITVSWEKPRHGSLTVETAVMGKSSLVNAGDVLINVYDSDTNAPLGGAAVQVTPSTGGNRTIHTDSADGEAFFGYVPAGPMTVAITKYGYAVDATPLQGATVPIDDIVQYAVYATRESTGKVRVTSSTTGQPIQGASVSLSGTGIDSRSGSTDAQGWVSFTGLPKGTFDIGVTAADFIPASGTLTVTAGASIVETGIALTSPAQVRIHVATAAGAPIQDARVDVEGVVKATGSSGDATFDLQESRSYAYTVSKTGFDNANGSFSATVGQQGTVNVTLVPTAPGAIRITVQKWGSSTRYSGRQVGVWAFDAASPGTIYTSNSSGQIIISNVTPYTYRARAQSKAYSTSEFTVYPGQTTDVTVWVTR